MFQTLVCLCVVCVGCVVCSLCVCMYVYMCVCAHLSIGGGEGCLFAKVITTFDTPISVFYLGHATEILSPSALLQVLGVVMVNYNSLLIL